MEESYIFKETQIIYHLKRFTRKTSERVGIIAQLLDLDPKSIKYSLVINLLHDIIKDCCLEKEFISKIEKGE